MKWQLNLFLALCLAAMTALSSATVSQAAPECVVGLVLNGNAMPNTINGGPNKDTIRGGGGNDVLRGLGCNDRIAGGSGNDYLYGGPGDDHLDGGPGNHDVCIGGPGVDTFSNACEVQVQ